jgi:hypothetical protein
MKNIKLFYWASNKCGKISEYWQSPATLWDFKIILFFSQIFIAIFGALAIYFALKS